MEFNQHFLNCVIVGCITDSTFLRKMRRTFPIEAFRSSVRKDLATLTYDHFDQYKESPKEHFYDLFYEFIDTINEKKRPLYYKLIESIKDISDINKEYITDKIHEAVRHIRIEEAIADAARFIKEKKYDEAERTFLKAIRDPVARAFGYIDYFKDRDTLIERMSEEQFLMVSMIPALDQIIIGFRRGETIVWLGAYKAGKTYGLISMAHAGLLQGLNVLFVSLELHRNRIRSRFDQTTGFLGGFKTRMTDSMVRRRGLWVKEKQEIDTIYDLDVVLKNSEALQKHGGRLIIASAPNATKNWLDIELLCDELETFESFIPHLICVDYLRNMSKIHSKQDRKEAVSENCQGLVKIGRERDLIMQTVQQGNRKAMTAPVFRPDMVADDIDVIGYADLIITVCQTEKEERDNQARLYLGAVREGPKGAQIRLTRDLGRGQFWLDSEIVTVDPQDDDEEFE